jgi:[protein-PII] uridylyltransferase
VVSHALEVVEAVEYAEPSLARQFREWRSRLSNADFTVARNRVFARSPGQLASDSGLVFRLIEFVARHGMPLSPETARRIASAPHEIARDARFQALWPALRAILSQPSASVALRAMQATGVLATLMPEWNRIDCLVVRDFYHRYTVDEHTIVAIESLENIEDKRFRDLLGEIENVSVLRFALLMHDTGKGSGRDHTGESERLAASVGERIGMPQEDLQTVRSLIQRHLELSSIMNSRDLEDASTARALADRVGTVELLRMLALMTYADISAVNPTAMTPWRAEQLWRAYLLGYHELTRELEAERIHDFADADSATRDFVEGLPNRYLRTHTIDQVHGHAALSARVAPKGAAVEISRHHGYWQVVTIANDRPGLFAAIAGALAAFGMNILKAEAFANSRGLIVDTFTFADPLRTLELNPSEVERLHDTLVRVLLKKQDVKRLLASRRPPARRPRRIEPRVTFDNDVSETATFIEVVAEDRPGLLYDLTSTMSRAGCDIVVVLIDTEADRALDVFYVTSGGAKLAAQLEETLRNDLLAVCSGSPGS